MTFKSLVINIKSGQDVVAYDITSPNKKIKNIVLDEGFYLVFYCIEDYKLFPDSSFICHILYNKKILFIKKSVVNKCMIK